MTISLLTAALSFLLFSPRAESQNPVDQALATLLRTDANTFWTDLDQSRPPAVQPSYKAAVLDALPVQGRVQNLKEPARRKLEAARQILQMHQRDSVYQLM